MKENSRGGSNRPIYSKRIGGIQLSVWENAKENRVFHNITVVRRYRDGDDWKESNSLNGLADIASLKEALIHVSNFISQREDELNGGDEE